MMRVRHLFLALMLVALLSPWANADHAFSHRYVIEGRAVDAEAHPIPGAIVSVTFAGTDGGSGSCFDARDERTKENGDFAICRHLHTVPEGANVTIQIGNTSASYDLDPLLRRTYARLTFAEPWPVRSIQGERAFYKNYTVTGRVFEQFRAPMDVDGVTVPAGNRDQNVTITLRSENGTVLHEAVVRTTEFGDYRADFFMPEVPPQMVVIVDAGFAEASRHASSVLRRTDVTFLREAPTPPPIPPGSGTGRIPFADAPLVALVLVIATLAAQRGHVTGAAPGGGAARRPPARR